MHSSRVFLSLLLAVASFAVTGSAHADDLPTGSVLVRAHAEEGVRAELYLAGADNDRTFLCFAPCERVVEEWSTVVIHTPEDDGWTRKVLRPNKGRDVDVEIKEGRYRTTLGIVMVVLAGGLVAGGIGLLVDADHHRGELDFVRPMEEAGGGVFIAGSAALAIAGVVVAQSKSSPRVDVRSHGEDEKRRVQPTPSGFAFTF